SRSEHHPYVVHESVIREGQYAGGGVEHLPIELELYDAPHDTSRIGDIDLVARGSVPQSQTESRPFARNARIDEERRAGFSDAEHDLDAGTVHPCRRARVPRPPPAPRVRRYRVDVGGHGIGFDLVRVHAGTGRGAIDRVE